MHIYGKFITQQDEEVTVDIRTASGSEEAEIEGEGSGVRWTANPVEITSEANDTFDHLLRQSCSIRLDCKTLLPALFSTSVFDAEVEVSRDGEVLFAGYIQPQTYEQPFNGEWDEVEVNCIDKLSALQYVNYKCIGLTSSGWLTEKHHAAQETLWSLLINPLLGVQGEERKGRIWYDGSRALPGDDDEGERIKGLLQGVSVSSHVFLGESEDELWTMQETLEETLRYLNLRVCQKGHDFYIYSWDSVKRGSAITWRNLLSLSQTRTWKRDSLEISIDNVADADASISFGEVYNRFSVEESVQGVETVVASPLDSGDTYDPYPQRMLYMEEFIVESSSKDSKPERAKAQLALMKMSQGESVDFDGAKRRNWYLRVRDNLKWRYNVSGISGFLSLKIKESLQQELIPYYLKEQQGAALLAFGKEDIDLSGKDNSLTSSIDMQTSLVVSVNGNGVDTEKGAFPDSERLLATAPVAEFQGNETGGLFSPSDNATTNYIVFSGRLTLVPLNEVSCPFRVLTEDEIIGDKWYGSLKDVPSREKDRRYYMQRWNFTTRDPDRPMDAENLLPDTGDMPQSLEFKYSAVGDSSDKVSKVAAVACMLIIGDKCAVEQTGDGSLGDIVWQKYKERHECKDDEEYFSQCFTLGFDPKIGDKLIGTEFPMQNNVSHTLGIDAEGTAIRIRKGDALQGRVRFIVLGPVYSLWNEVTRRHKTWFRSAKWGSSDIPLMAHVSSVFISDFDVKMVSDNAHNDGENDVDLVYMSDTQEKIVSAKDPFSFKITTALTADERTAIGASAVPALSQPVIDSEAVSLLQIEDTVTGETAKPEQLYVDAAYREHHLPRLRIAQRLIEAQTDVSMFNNYTHPALPGRAFFVTGISRNLIEGWALLNLKETDQ